MQGDKAGRVRVAAQGITRPTGTVFALLHVLPKVGSGPDTLQALNDRVRGSGLRTQGSRGGSLEMVGGLEQSPLLWQGSLKAPKA